MFWILSPIFVFWKEPAVVLWCQVSDITHIYQFDPFTGNRNISLFGTCSFKDKYWKPLSFVLMFSSSTVKTEFKFDYIIRMVVKLFNATFHHGAIPSGLAFGETEKNVYKYILYWTFHPGTLAWKSKSMNSFLF